MRLFVGALGLLATLAFFSGCSGKNKSSFAGAGGAASGASATGGGGAGAGNAPGGAGASGAAAEPGVAGGDGGVGSAGAGGMADGGASDVDAGSAGAGTSHLLPWQVEAEGTDPLVMGIYDSEAQVHCRFLTDQAGQLRCLPWSLASFTETTSFSDAACTKRIYLTDNTVGPTWVGRPTALPLPRTACSARRYSVGTLGVLPADAPHYGGTPCAAIQPAPAPGFGQAEMTVVETQATDRWQKGTRVDGPLIGGRMRVKQVQMADGTRFLDDFADEHWNKPCHLVASGDDVVCQTAAVTSITGNEGTQCTGLPVWRAHACDDPSFLGSAILSPFAAVGPVWSGPVSHGGQGCTLLPASSTIDGPDVFYTTGAPLPDAVMDPKSWQATGTGRLRLRGLTDGDGKVVTFPSLLLWSELDTAVVTGAHARYFDAVANTTCNPVRTPEGVLRCLPTSVVSVQSANAYGFADDKCTVPAFFCPSYAASCPGVVVAQVTLASNGELQASSLNTARALTTSYTSPAGTCIPVTFTSPGRYALDTAQAWTQYPAFAESNGRAPDSP